MGKSVIVTNIDAHREILGSAKCAFFIDDNCPTNIRIGVENAYKHRRDLRKLGRIGRNIVRRKFTWEIQAEALLRYISSI